MNGYSDQKHHRHKGAKAAQYVRMSTDHQKYSTDNQKAVITQFARDHEIEIIKTYSDDGKSGLSLKGRQGLARMLSDIQCGLAEYSVVLVYDVSRWGRFQSIDEAGHYEFLVKNAGIDVEYCAEQFRNDGTSYADLVKTIKRTMAGEYSRELSEKVFAGQCRLIEMGYRQGGPAGFGLRRQLIDEYGDKKQILGKGDRKSLQTDRVILVPGPDDEVQLVNHIYRLFADGNKSEAEIARLLNNDGCFPAKDEVWSKGKIHQILTNEKYIGNNVFNRTSFKLKQERVKNTEDKWVRKEKAFEPIVPENLFHLVKGIIRGRCSRYSDDELLSRLKSLYQNKGELSGIIIDETENMPSSSAYRNRFGSLIRAYKLVGYTPERDYRYIEINRLLRQKYPTIVGEIVEKIERLGGYVVSLEDDHSFNISDEFSVSLVLARSQELKSGQLRWNIRFERQILPDLTVAVRMNATNTAVHDYYLFPHLDSFSAKIKLQERNCLSIDAFRLDDLEPLYFLSKRIHLEQVA